MDYAYEAITWTIIVAFILTTIVTLLGVVQKITIPTDYLNKLFAALILEIVACGFIIFRNGPIVKPTPPEVTYFQQGGDLYKIAVRQLDAKQPDLAENSLRSIIRLQTPGLPFDIAATFKELGNIYVDRPDWLGASHALGIYYEMRSSDFDPALKYAHALQKIGRYDESKNILEYLAKQNGSSIAVFNGLINVYSRKAAFDKFAQLPDLSDQEFGTALEYAKRALAIVGQDKVTPAYPQALANQARVYWQMGNQQVALQQLTDIVSNFPNFIPAQEDKAALLLEIGQASGDQKKISDARDIFRDLYEKKPDGSTVEYNASGLAEAAAEAHDTPAEELTLAQNAALSAIATTPNDPYCSYAAALIFKRNGDVPQAKIYLETAIRLERGRAINPYVFDYDRLSRYQLMLESWDKS